MPPELPEVAAGDRLGRDRHRVRELLSHLGAEVTVVEVLDRILPVEDEEVSAFAKQGLREAGHEDPDRRHGREARRRAPTTSRPRSKPAARARRSPSTA